MSQAPWWRLWFGSLLLSACASRVERPVTATAGPATNEAATATGREVDANAAERERPPTADQQAPASDATSAQDVSEAAGEGGPADRESCEQACIAAAAESANETAEEMENLRQLCPKTPASARARCLADVDGQAEEIRIEEEGSEHACRTNCPGYLDRF
jgi:hypothetical protein